MIRRYDMARSDNYHATNVVSEASTGSGTLNVTTAFPVTSAIVAFSNTPSESASIFVSAYLSDGFTVTYADIPAGGFEFSYYAQ